MADYLTQFSCALDVGTPENAARALDIYNALSEGAASDDAACGGFALSILHEESGARLCMHDEGSGDPERVIQFVKRCAAEFHLTGLWGFQYANVSSKSRLDGFGGGAHVLDLASGKTVAWISTDEWLAETLDGGDANA